MYTWTAYGNWLPGDIRGWRKRKDAERPPQPPLARWCADRMIGDEVLLSDEDRRTVEDACHEHCDFRGWCLYAVNARSNHVHAVVTAAERPKKVRDQLKANCTRRLRLQENPLIVERTWARGGDISILDTDEEIELAILYVLEAQDRKWSDYKSFPQ